MTGKNESDVKLSYRVSAPSPPKKIALQVEQIGELGQQREISAYTEILAGLKFDRDLIRRFLREELMRESVIYQEIQQEALQRGVEQGRQQGLQQGLEREVSLVLRQLIRQLGQISSDVRSQLHPDFSPA